MHLLYVLHGYKPAHRMGGPVISVSSAAEAIVRKGHRVTVFTTNCNLDEDLDVPTDRPVDVDGVEVWYFRRREILKRLLPFVPYVSKSIGYLHCPKMAAELDRIVPTVDAVHAQMPFVWPTRAAARAARQFGKPLFYHQRGVFDPERLKFRSVKKRLYIRLVERPIMRQAATLIALTSAEADSYRALGVDTPCRVIPNGIHVGAYRASADPAWRRWPIAPDAQVVLFLSRLHPIKGADRLLEAFGRIAERFPRAVLVLAGPDEFGLEAEFRRQSASASAEGRVIFAGMVSGADKTNLLARADLFCLPSDAEGFSMAVLEAMASGTAVLLSPGCHFDEVESAGAGRVAPPDADSLAAALAEMLADPAALAAMGRRGREFVAANYTWDRIADQLLEAYREGIERSAGRRPT